MATDGKLHINPLGAAVAGAVAGAAAVTLADKANRDKLVSSVKQLQKKGSKAIHDVMSRVEEAKEEGAAFAKKQAIKAKGQMAKT